MAATRAMTYGCPLWDADGDPLELEGAWLGIHDASAPIVRVPLREGLPELIVAQGLTDDHLATSRYIWNAAIVLCELFASCMHETQWEASTDEPPIRAVELGAGTGVCAAALARCLGGDHQVGSSARCMVVATDLPQSLPLIEDTVKRNELQDCLSVEALDWGDISAHGVLSGADLVFGADVTYSDAALPLLFSLMNCACRQGSVALLAHEHRASNREEFETALVHGLRVEQTIPQGACDSALSWAEIIVPGIVDKARDDGELGVSIYAVVPIHRRQSLQRGPFAALLACAESWKSL